MHTKTPTAIILANGPAILNGVQLSTYPKLLLPIANHPLAEYQGAVLASAGVKLLIIVVSADYGQVAQDVHKCLSKFPFEVKWIVQDKPRGTAGSLKQVEDLIKADSFWVVSGDLLLDADLTRVAAHHFDSASSATVGAVSVEEPAWEMERIEIDSNSLIKNVHRIHPAYSRRSRLRPVGLYLFEPAVLNAIPDEGHFDIKEQLIPTLYSSSLTSRVWEIREYCQTISSFDRYISANWDVLLKRAPFHDLQLWELAGSKEASVASQDFSAFVVPPVSVSPDAHINGSARLIGPTCIGSKCRVGKDVILNSCVLMDSVEVKTGARITNCIVSEGTLVEEGTEWRDMVVLPDSLPGHDSLLYRGIRNGASVNAEHLSTGSAIVGNESYRHWKRVFDAVFAFCALLVTAPLLVLIAIAVRMDSQGPIIFRQRRCGHNGVQFDMYKFRTMVNNAEDVKREIQCLNEVDGPMFKISEDPRTTRVGRVLRAINLDEIPQFWNVLKGDLSVVGPRPLSWDEMRFNPRWRDIRLSCPQGIVGLWQVYSHSNPSFADWIHYDITYVGRCSFWFDMKIIMLTLWKGTLGLFKLVVGLVRRK
ncbi:MAG: sugar transferase [Syntrophobacteraceae bacterium]